MPEKNFKIYLVVNWKTEEVKIRKSKPEDWQLEPFEIPLSINLLIKLPERKELEASGTVTVSEGRVEKMILKEIVGEEYDDKRDRRKG